MAAISMSVSTGECEANSATIVIPEVFMNSKFSMAGESSNSKAKRKDIKTKDHQVVVSGINNMSTSYSKTLCEHPIMVFHEMYPKAKLEWSEGSGCDHRPFVVRTEVNG